MSDSTSDSSQPNKPDADPKLAVSPRGTVAVVWLDERRRVYVSTRAALSPSWSNPVCLSSTGAYDPNIVAAPDGTFTAIWTSLGDSEARVVSVISTPEGGSWSTSSPLSGSTFAHAPQVFCASDGRLIAAWHLRKDRDNSWSSMSGHQTGIEAASCLPGSERWSLRETVTGDRGAKFPVIAASSDGTAAIAWHTETHIGETVWVATRRATDEDWWSHQSRLSPERGHARLPSIAVTEAGTFVVVWTGISPDGGVVWASTNSPGDTEWAAPVALSRIGDSAGAANIVVTDGRVVAVWPSKDGFHASFCQADTTLWSAPAGFFPHGLRSDSISVAPLPGGSVAVAWHAWDEGLRPKAAVFDPAMDEWRDLETPRMPWDPEDPWLGKDAAIASAGDRGIVLAWATDYGKTLVRSSMLGAS